ncbi:hypothetical protein Tco_1361424 [Tanacetum coccineum]
MLRYLKGQPKLGLWYPKDSPFDLVAYTDSDYAGASLDREVHNRRPEYVTALKLLWPSALDSKSSVDWTKHNEIDITPSRDSNEKKLIQMIKIHTDKNVADLLTKAFDWSTERIADEATNEETVPKQSNDPPLSRVNTLGSGEDRLKLKESIDLSKEIASLKKRVKELERKRKSKTSGMKRLFKIGRPGQVVSSEDEGLDDQEDASKQERKIDDIDQDAEVTLVDETQRRRTPVKKMSKKELLKLNEELAFKLQAKEEEQARLAREKAEKVEEANIS